MKVIELINKLKNLDPHLEVYILEPLLDELWEKTGEPGRKYVPVTNVGVSDDKAYVE